MFRLITDTFLISQTKKRKHVVFGHSAAGSLRQFFASYPNEEEIICFWDNLSIGPIPNLTIAQRIAYYKKIAPAFIADSLPYLKASYNDTRAIMPHEQLIIWHGSYLPEQLMLAYLCDCLPANSPLYEITLPAPTGACPLTSLPELLQRTCLLSAEKKQALQAQWQKLCKNDTELRAYREGTVENVPLSFYDQALQEYTGKWQKIAQVIGHLLLKNIGANELFLYARIQALIQAGQLLTKEDHHKVTLYGDWIKWK